MAIGLFFFRWELQCLVFVNWIRLLHLCLIYFPFPQGALCFAYAVILVDLLRGALMYLDINKKPTRLSGFLFGGR